MPNDLQDPALSTQVTDGTAGQNQEPFPGNSTGADGTSGQPLQDGTADGQIGSGNLPPELEETRKQLMRDYHSKMQEIKDQRLRFERDMDAFKNKSQTLDTLLTQDWFKRAAQDETKRRNGQVSEMELSDEQFQQATTDKNAFMKLVSTVAERIASAKVGQVEPGLGQTQASLQELKAEREFETVANNPRYKDFRTLNEQGRLDPYLEKGADFEAAYKQYKFDHPERATVPPLTDSQRRDGSISSGGQTQVSNGQRIIKARNLDEAFDAAWDELQRGNQNFKLERAA